MERSTTSRNIEAKILQGVAKTGLVKIADELGCDKSTVSRMKKDGDFEKFARILSVCNLKVVPGEHRLANPELVDALVKIATTSIEKGGSSFVWDDSSD